MLSLIPLKILVTVAMVLGLARIAERVSTRLAGVLVGVPLGSAVTLVFFGIEQGPVFAAEAAVYNLGGLVAVLAFLLGYQTGLSHKPTSMPLCLGLGLASYFLVASTIQGIAFHTPAESALLLITAILAATLYFHHYADDDIHHPIRAGTRMTAARALFAAFVVVAVTEAASVIGSHWSGILSAFPVTLMPLILIIHYSYPARNVEAIIKNEPMGMLSIVFFSTTVWATYPIYGVAVGTILAYLAALTYTSTYWFGLRRHITF